MMKRISRTIALATAMGAFAASGVGVAQASHGADDPAGHERHHRHHHHHHHGERERRHGDGPNHG